MKKFLASILGLAPSEVWLIGIFIILQPFIGGNRDYFLTLAALFILIFIFSKSILETTWLTFLAALPFSRGKYFDFMVVPASFWGGEFDLGLRAPFLFSDALLALAAYLVLSRYKNLRSKFKVSSLQAKTLLFLFLFMAVSFISSYISFFPLTSFYYFAQLSKFVVLFFVGRVVLDNNIAANKSIKIFVLFLLLNSLLAIAQYLNKGPIGLSIEGQSKGYGVYGLYAIENPDLFRAGGFSPDPNVTATLLAISFPILLINTLISGKSYLQIKWLALSVLIVALILTASRTLWVLSTISATITFFYLKRNFTIIIPPFIKKSLVIFVILVSLLLSPILLQRLVTLVDIFGSKGGGTYRIEHIKIGLYYLKRHTFGTGLGTFNYSMAYDFPPQKSGLIPAQAHNLLAQLGAETGVLGLISFSIFLFLLVKEKFRSSLKNPINFGVFLSLSSYLLSAFFFPWFLHPFMGTVFWITCAYPMKPPQARRLGVSSFSRGDRLRR